MKKHKNQTRRYAVMKTVKISLNSIDKVKAFVNEVTKYDAEFDLVSGRYVIDAKSIMGIFSLDLSKPIDLNIHSENNVDEILAKLSQFIVE
jgi:phosphotransferase system HPr-like phosphotransfer protein